MLEFENTHSKVVTKLNGDWEEDKLLDDTSLVFDGEEGLVILSGWAHAGICNTVEAAKAITGKNKIQDIVGGFHLLHPTEERMDKTANYLSQLGLSHITPLPLHRFPFPLPMGRTGAPPWQRQRVGIPLTPGKTVFVNLSKNSRYFSPISTILCGVY